MGPEIRMQPWPTEKPRKWQVFGGDKYWKYFYCKVTETQSEVEHLAGRQPGLGENGPRLSPVGSSSLDNNDNDSFKIV